MNVSNMMFRKPKGPLEQPNLNVENKTDVESNEVSYENKAMFFYNFSTTTGVILLLLSFLYNTMFVLQKYIINWINLIPKGPFCLWIVNYDTSFDQFARLHCMLVCFEYTNLDEIHFICIFECVELENYFSYIRKTISILHAIECQLSSNGSLYISYNTLKHI